MASISAAIRRAVFDRADGRCEYCLIHNDDTNVPHEVDHIVAEKHGGLTQEDNLCLSCFACNRHKGSDLTSIDPSTGTIIPLFNPRRDRWEQHFTISESEVEGLSEIGRVTVRLLQMNHPDRLAERRALIRLGRYP